MLNHMTNISLCMKWLGLSYHTCLVSFSTTTAEMSSWTVGSFLPNTKHSLTSGWPCSTSSISLGETWLFWYLENATYSYALVISWKMKWLNLDMTLKLLSTFTYFMISLIRSTRVKFACSSYVPKSPLRINPSSRKTSLLASGLSR